MERVAAPWRGASSDRVRPAPACASLRDRLPHQGSPCPPPRSSSARSPRGSATPRAGLAGRDARAAIGRRGFDDGRGRGVRRAGDDRRRDACGARTAGTGSSWSRAATGRCGTRRRRLASSGVEVGILPCGTGNLYAAAVGVPRALPAAIEALATGVATPFDHATVQLVAPPGGPGQPDRCRAWASASRAGPGSTPSSSRRPIAS